MTADYLDSQNRGLALGAEIARGGEGVVFEVVSRQEIVAKVYHKEISTDKIPKLHRMVQMNSLVLGRIAAWPLDLVSIRPTHRPPDAQGDRPGQGHSQTLQSEKPPV